MKLKQIKYKIIEKYQRARNWVLNHKKTSIGIAAGVGILTLVGLVALFTGMNNSIERTGLGDLELEVDEVSNLVPSPLTGVLVKPSLANRPVTGIVIENSPDARPQSGLDKADFVFEAVAEGGITRFITFWQETRDRPIGPVRSLRPYFNDWVMTFDASVAHVGGSGIALNQVKKFNIKDLDQFHNPQAYYRTSDRFAPHNVYTNSQNLDKLNKQKGFNSSTFDPIPRKDPAPVNVSKARRIQVPISSPLYNIEWRYEKSSNSYRRIMGGLPHNDREGKTPISPDTVVIMEARRSIAPNGIHTLYKLSGGGKVKVIQDGRVVSGTWTKPGRDKQISFTAKNGKTIKLNRGQTWLTVVDPGTPVKVSK